MKCQKYDVQWPSFITVMMQYICKSQQHRGRQSKIKPLKSDSRDNVTLNEIPLKTTTHLIHVLFSQYLQSEHIDGMEAQLLLLLLWVGDLRSDFILSIEDLRHSLLFLGTVSGMWLHMKWVPLWWKNSVHIIPDGFFCRLYDSSTNQISNPVNRHKTIDV